MAIFNGYGYVKLPEGTSKIPWFSFRKKPAMLLVSGFTGWHCAVGHIHGLR